MINGTITFIIYWALPTAGLYTHTPASIIHKAGIRSYP
jgi:hypothetical protein